MRVLVVDDNPLDRTACRTCFERRSWPVVEAATAEEAFAYLEAEAPEVVVSDHDLRGAHDGIDVLARARHVRPAALRVLMSGFIRPDLLVRARTVAGIHAFVEKPLRPADWDAELARAVPPR